MFEVNKILLTTVYVILICLVTVIFVSFFLSITMTRRLHIIIDRVKNFSAADMNFRKMNNLGGDEIGKLSAVFDLMEQKNRILIKEIYESKIEQKDAELKALQAQINPHFLYNCLDNINIRSILLGDTQISNVVTMLADFYRTSLNKGRNTTLLADEVKNVTAYISLLIELGAKFKVEYDIDENALNYTMISLTLQPIVENAFKHGVFNIGDNGFIRVTIKPQDDKIIISVFDNGKSITEEQAEIALNGKNKGYGLKNVNTRIKLFFGDSYGVQIFGVKGGTECVVTIPAIQYKIDDTNE